MEFKRADRVAGLLQEEISTIIQKELSDPKVRMATITAVKMSDDLRRAKVYFACDSKKQKSTKLGLERSSGFIKRQLGKTVQLRNMPKLTFYYDSTLDYSDKIDRLIKEVHKNDG